MLTWKLLYFLIQIMITKSHQNEQVAIIKINFSVHVGPPIQAITEKRTLHVPRKLFRNVSENKQDFRSGMSYFQKAMLSYFRGHQYTDSPQLKMVQSPIDFFFTLQWCKSSTHNKLHKIANTLSLNRLCIRRLGPTAG